MKKTGKHLLIIDAPGGPHPSFYLPMLPNDINVTVIVVEYEKSLYQLSRLESIKQFTHNYIIASSNDYLSIIRNYVNNYDINGILAFSERIVHKVGKLANDLNLISNSYETYDLLQHKDLQRKRLSETGITTPRNIVITSLNDIDKSTKFVKFPAVLKPVIGMGSLSVFEINNLDQLKSIYIMARDLYTNDTRVNNNSPKFLLEEKMIGINMYEDKRLGDYVSVESLVFNGVVCHLAITDQLPLSYPFRENGHIMPSCLDKAYCNKIFNLAGAGIKAMGIMTGAVHTEIKLTAYGPCIIEINGRIGGSIAQLIWYASNYNIIKDLAYIALGIEPCETPHFYRYSAFFTPQPPPYNIKLTKVPTISQINNISGVISSEIVFSENACPDWRIGTASNLARVTAATDQYNNLLNIFDIIKSERFFKFVKL